MTLKLEEVEPLLNAALLASESDFDPEDYPEDEDEGYVNWHEVEDWLGGNYNYETRQYETKPEFFKGCWIELEENFGGSGQGDQYWIVVSIAKDGVKQYFRKSGWYASYDGGHYDGNLEEVRPQEVIKIEWVKK